MRRLVLSWLLLAAAGCISELEPDVGAIRAGTCRSEDTDPFNDVSYKEDVLPLFQRSGLQGGCSCHQPGNRSTSGIDETGLSLLDYASLMRGTSSGQKVVVPGDPCASEIVQKVSNAPPTGARMPPGGPPFMTTEEIALLRDWIAEGANDN